MPPRFIIPLPASRPSSYRLFTVEGNPGPDGGAISDSFRMEGQQFLDLAQTLKPGEVLQLKATEADFTDMDDPDDPNAIDMSLVEWDVIAEARG
jgi:hypothetical protein